MEFRPLFVSERLRLDAQTSDDRALFARWSHDSQYGRMLDDDPFFPMNDATFERWVGQPSEQTGGHYAFMIVTRDGERRIGFCALMNLKWASRTGMLAVGIGEPDARGKGYGHEALTMLLNFAFDELNLHRVGLTVMAYNAPAIRLYEKLGFTLEGRQREMVLRQSQYSDILQYGLLSREWHKD
jgi:RimJ/RimL family protein N-acetyltransferase